MGGRNQRMPATRIARRLTAEIGELFYVNDFAQLSAFKKNDQLFSFYHLVNQIDVSAIKTSNHTIPITEEGEKFRWVDLSELTSDTVTFPIDKIVAQKLSKL